IVDPTVDRVRTGGGRHRLADDAIDARGGLGHRRAELLGEFTELLLRAGKIELHVAAEKVVGGEIPQREIGIGDAWLRAAAPVTDRPRRRAGALRADLEKAEVAHRRDAAAARADLDHVDGGNEDRQAAARLEAIDAVDLEVADHERRAILDDARFR